MGGAAIAADDISTNDNDGMQMVRHDDMILNLYHGIMSGDARGQLLLYHHTDIRQRYPRRLRVAVRLGGIADDSAEQLA